jgi:hypothetical protein
MTARNTANAIQYSQIFNTYGCNLKLCEYDYYLLTIYIEIYFETCHD